MGCILFTLHLSRTFGVRTAEAFSTTAQGLFVSASELQGFRVNGLPGPQSTHKNVALGGCC